MIAPIGAATFSEAVRWGAETYHALKSVLKQHGLSTGVGDEGGFAPDLDTQPGRARPDRRGDRQGRVQPGPRRRAGRRRRRHRVLLRRRLPVRGGRRSAAEMTRIYAEWLDAYPIVSLEDPLAEEDWAGWTGADRGARRPGADRRRRSVRHQSRTPAPRHRRAQRERAAGQGEPDRHDHRDARRGGPGPAQRVQLHDQPPVGETEDTTIADLAVAINAGRSSRARRPGPSGSPSTTSCCGSRNSSTTRPATPAPRRSPAGPRLSDVRRAAPAAAAGRTGPGSPAGPRCSRW